MWTQNAILGIETTLEDVFGRYTGVAISIIKEEFPDALCIERRKLLSGGTRLGARVSRLYSLVKWLLLCYAELVPGKQSEVWSLLQSIQYCYQNLNTLAQLRLAPLLFEIFGISSTGLILPYQHTPGPSPFFTGSCIKKCSVRTHAENVARQSQCRYSCAAARKAPIAGMYLKYNVVVYSISI